MKIVATSGYFNPLHKGHIEYLERAKNLGDKLIVIVNNDFQVKLKGSKEFMDEQERLMIIRSLRYVDMAILAVDRDPTVCKTLEVIRPHIFAKGGDRFTYEIPESKICRDLGIAIVDGLGAKVQSSSWLLGRKD
jgi:D-beta-D-heptose 7-phosphate kinase/D-beta-D-heptose 1-phosphate adenosyltransferase